MSGSARDGAAVPRGRSDARVAESPGEGDGMDDSLVVGLGLVVGVTLLYLGSHLRRRRQRRASSAKTGGGGGHV
jgi:hypothetical protein